MADLERFLGHIIDFDAKTDVLMIKIDFLIPEKQLIIEDLFVNKKEFSFIFRKPFRRLKTYPQLKKYFQLLKNILLKAEVYPEAEIIKTLDVEVKKSILPCKQIEVDGHIIPIVPSKADLSTEEMGYLISEVMNRYNVE